MISSTKSPRVKNVTALLSRAKERKKQKLFIVEGPRMFEEIPAGLLRETYVAEGYLAQHGEEAERMLDGTSYEIVTDDVMRAMSDTIHPQGVLAVVSQKEWAPEDVLTAHKDGHPALLMVLETLQDPGNLGTILRMGEGAGVTGLLVNEETADIYNPKVIRSTMGSIYRMPVLRVSDLPAAVREAKQKGIRMHAAHLGGISVYDREDYTGPSAFMIGNEAAGLSDTMADLADILVRIPMAGQVESLNAAVAASVLAFEAARQRRMI